MDPLDRAAEIFWSLKMDHTQHRNSVLLYVAIRDHQFAIFADQGNGHFVACHLYANSGAEDAPGGAAKFQAL